MLSLNVDAVTVRYPGLSSPVLDVPSLFIAPGSRVVITGASGSGKSTLVNIMTGLERVRDGYVRWGDTDIAVLSERARDRWRGMNIGLFMQDFHLFPGLSAFDNVMLPARLSRAAKKDDEIRAKSLLHEVGLQRPEQSVETMSRGEMQRVAIARALLRRPSILIADEPTASLDTDSADAVAHLLLALSLAEGSTLIVVSHDPRLTRQLDRCLTLVAGRIASDSSVEGKVA
ncbi:putative ABC transport system ATP-binding protein [Pararhizobium capsulatum DSM 1112]|uniref:ABC transport system ATP-binding protein n=1 Tax=Pararhizobium capsulatum DSM 1112 TaxID=1121113 RepID=A0ABU0BIV6_9HYPH|nr:ATP-binding cassette domain-containing protein [Pararhizobium capsulatum]MDQ0318181.1 putative ABC transport system ATP-binding protein [Pararhizobium capsulatum DSM 1112]